MGSTKGRIRRSSEQQQDLAPIYGMDAWSLAARHELRGPERRSLGTFACGIANLELCLTAGSLWLMARWPESASVAWRLVYAPAGLTISRCDLGPGGGGSLRLTSEACTFDVRIVLPPSDPNLLRATVTLTTQVPLMFPYSPRDLYPLGQDDDPCQSRGIVYAGQRADATALLLLSICQPGQGTLLYFQNLTALNDFCKATESLPENIVGGHWPQLGLTLPSSKTGAVHPDRPTVISDGFLHFTAGVPPAANIPAVLLSGLDAIYPNLEQPAAEFHDWPERARRTVWDLAVRPDVTERQQGHLYVTPYAGAEPPDSMVQMTVASCLDQYARWQRQPTPFAAELLRAMRAFFDEDAGLLRRYLPWAPAERKPHVIDSWYLYHPLINLVRTAHLHEEPLRSLLPRALEHAIHAARHFDYNWPISFDLYTLEEVQSSRGGGGMNGYQRQRGADGAGETDVAGLYTYLMLKAHETLGDPRYLKEARHAIDHCQGVSFDLSYQLNLTAWGAAACLRLWRQTDEARYLRSAELFLGNFFHNSVLWECDLDASAAYPTFMGVKCLHDGEYMAIFEEYESAMAFAECLAVGGSDLPRPIQRLLAEFFRHLLHRAWFYYPDVLPQEVLATEPRDGRIERDFSFPLEDLYVGNGKPGSVGQEVYGCGAAMMLTSFAFHRLATPRLIAYCDYPVLRIREIEGGSELTLGGHPDHACELRLLPYDCQTLPAARVVQLAHGETQESVLQPAAADEAAAPYLARGASRIRIIAGA